MSGFFYVDCVVAQKCDIHSNKHKSSSSRSGHNKQESYCFISSPLYGAKTQDMAAQKEM